jgi:hypothetical protein
MRNPPPLKKGEENYTCINKIWKKKISPPFLRGSTALAGRGFAFEAKICNFNIGPKYKPILTL